MGTGRSFTLAEGGRIIDLARRQSGASAPAAPVSVPAPCIAALLVGLLRLRSSAAPLGETHDVGLRGGRVDKMLPWALMPGIGWAGVVLRYFGLAGSHPLETQVFHGHVPHRHETPTGSGRGARMSTLRGSLFPFVSVFTVAVAPMVVSHPHLDRAGDRHVTRRLDVTVVRADGESVLDTRLRGVLSGDGLGRG